MRTKRKVMGQSKPKILSPAATLGRYNECGRDIRDILVILFIRISILPIEPAFEWALEGALTCSRSGPYVLWKRPLCALQGAPMCSTREPCPREQVLKNSYRESLTLYFRPRLKHHRVQL